MSFLGQCAEHRRDHTLPFDEILHGGSAALLEGLLAGHYINRRSCLAGWSYGEGSRPDPMVEPIYIM
jgi:hypothetical protein